MYERTLGDQVLTFGHEGVLFEQSFVMYDHQTDSLWLHVTAESIKGPLKGQRLTFFPSTVTTWEAWKKQHPETTVLTGERDEGFMGTFRGLKAADRKQFGLAVLAHGNAHLVPYTTLDREPLVAWDWAGQSVFAVSSARLGVARAWSASLDGEDLVFEWLTDDQDEALIKEVETDSVFDALTGRCVEGAYEGEALEPLVSFPILTDRFGVFFPEGTGMTQDVEGERPGQDKRRKDDHDDLVPMQGARE